MDRRSWLWRRKSSEKSPGEIESIGSISSHSERFSDEQVGDISVVLEMNPCHRFWRIGLLNFMDNWNVFVLLSNWNL